MLQGESAVLVGGRLTLARASLAFSRLQCCDETRPALGGCFTHRMILWFDPLVSPIQFNSNGILLNSVYNDSNFGA